MPGSSPISFIRVTPTSHADWWRACGGERGRRQEEERAEETRGGEGRGGREVGKWGGGRMGRGEGWRGGRRRGQRWRRGSKEGKKGERGVAEEEGSRIRQRYSSNITTEESELRGSLAKPG